MKKEIRYLKLGVIQMNNDFFYHIKHVQHDHKQQQIIKYIQQVTGHKHQRQ